MGTDALTRFDAEVLEVEQEAKKPMELPEASFDLALGRRGADARRVARTIHQNCAMHGANFRRANFVRVAYAGRMYVTEAHAANPLGITAAARGLLELNAFLRYVQGELVRISSGPPQHWQSRGQDFFNVVVRARYGTSDKGTANALTAVGVPAPLLKPFHIMDCVRQLAKTGRFDWLEPHYDFLCDWVHTNQAGQTASTASMRESADLAMGSNRLTLPKPTPIVEHRYAATAPSEYLVARTLEQARTGFADALAAIRETPETPFTDTAERIRLTGTASGFGEA